MPNTNTIVKYSGLLLWNIVLSRRVLYLGIKRMHIECPTNVQFENYHHAIECHGFDAEVNSRRSLNAFCSEINRFEWGLDDSLLFPTLFDEAD